MQASASSSSETPQTQRRPPPSPMVQWLEHTTDVALAAVILVAPLFMGGRGPVGRMVFVALVSIAAIAWFSRSCCVVGGTWRWSGAEVLLLLGGLLVVGQLIPLPSSWLSALSPAIGKLLPLWTDPQAAVQIGKWSTISLTPEHTRAALATYLSYILLFVVLVQRIANVNDLRWLLRCIACAAVGMALVGLAQFLFGNGKFLWIYEHPSRQTYDSVKGTFQNQNHFTHFLALGIGPILYWLWDAGQRRPIRSLRRQGSLSTRDPSRLLAGPGRPFLFVCLALVAVAGLMSYSRGGIVVLAIAIACGAVVYAWHGLLERRLAWALLGAALVIAVALAIHGGDVVSNELGTLYTFQSLGDVSQGRVALWNAIWTGIQQFPRLGSGVGSQCEVYPIYMEEYFNINFSHGESGYLPLLLETGIPGLALMLAGIGVSLGWCLRTLWHREEKIAVDGEGHGRGELKAMTAVAGAIFPGWLVSVVHAVADFTWYIPACMSLTVVLLACACRAFQLKRALVARELRSNRGNPEPGAAVLPRAAWLALTLVIAMMAAGMIQNRVGPALAAADWQAYLRLSSLNRSKVVRTPSEEREQLALMQQHLQESLARHPHDATAHMRLAAVCLKRFELEQRSSVNPMGLAQIRDAALASAFPSKQQLDDWLSVAIGDNVGLLELALRHCKRGLHLCPLQGAGYVYYADLCFLEDPREATKDDCVRQASLVRPYSGLVLYSQAKEAALSGRLDQALEYWKKAFAQDPEVQSLIIESFAAQLPAAAFLATFESDSAVLAQLFEHYRSIGRVEDARLVAERWPHQLVAESRSMPPSRAAVYWQLAASACASLGESDKALRCAERAVELTPNDVSMRRGLATFLLQDQCYGQAMEHLTWCLRRNPGDAALRQQLADAKLHRDRAEHAASLSRPDPDAAQY